MNTNREIRLKILDNHLEKSADEFVNIRWMNKFEIMAESVLLIRESRITKLRYLSDEDVRGMISALVYEFYDDIFKDLIEEAYEVDNWLFFSYIRGFRIKATEEDYRMFSLSVFYAFRKKVGNNIKKLIDKEKLLQGMELH